MLFIKSKVQDAMSNWGIKSNRHKKMATFGVIISVKLIN